MRAIILFAFMAAFGLSFGVMIPNGECLNLTVLNETDNSTWNETYCAGNATIIYNITENITYNVTNVTNVTVVQCNATNATMWANSTATFNNATVTCLSNFTVIINNTIYMNATVPSAYCYQNIKQTMGYLEVFRNDVCNITITSPSDKCTPCAVCQTCPTCPTCAVCQECAAPRICEECNNETFIYQANACTAQLAELNTSAKNYAYELAVERNKSSQYLSLEQLTEQKSEEAAEPINTTLQVLFFGAVAGFVVWRIKIAGHASSQPFPRENSVENIERLKQYAEEKLKED